MVVWRFDRSWSIFHFTYRYLCYFVRNYPSKIIILFSLLPNDRDCLFTFLTFMLTGWSRFSKTTDFTSYISSYSEGSQSDTIYCFSFHDVFSERKFDFVYFISPSLLHRQSWTFSLKLCRLSCVIGVRRISFLWVRYYFWKYREFESISRSTKRWNTQRKKRPLQNKVLSKDLSHVSVKRRSLRLLPTYFNCDIILLIFSTAWKNMQIAREIEERDRLDEMSFKKAGRAPPAKTFKENPLLNKEPLIQAKKN